LDEIRVHATFSSTLRLRLCWCKNVMEERAAPQQIIMGANNPHFCPILNLTMYLEILFPTDVNNVGKLHLFGSINKSANGIKKRIIDFLKAKVFKSETFKASTQESIHNIGTHSIRKMAATHTRRNDYSRDDINIRGRWKRNKQIVDAYLDPEIPYLDARAAAALCIGGPIKYEAQKEAGLDDCWVLTYVAPRLSESLEDQKAAVVLGKALLWACFDTSVSENVPPQVIKRVLLKYEHLRRLVPTENPVRRIPLVVCGHEGQLVIDELLDDEGEGESNNISTNNEDITRKRSRQSAATKAVFAQLMEIRKQNEELKREMEVLRCQLSKRVKYLGDSVNRLTIVSARVRTNFYSNVTNNNSNSNDDGTSDAQPRPVTLCKNPKSLYTLWHEYEYGVGPRKAAKHFSSRDRGANRSSYSKRKAYWDLVLAMVNRGKQANQAIDEIYKHYGYKTSVSNIIKFIQRERTRRTGFLQFF
jgi:hypothetical protein